MKVNLKHTAFALTLSLFFGLALGQTEQIRGKVIHQPLTQLTKNTTTIYNNKDIPVLTFQKPDVESLLAEDATRDKNGEVYRFGIGTNVNITTANSGEWSTNESGDRIWKLKIHQPGALALSFIFSKFDLKGK